MRKKDQSKIDEIFKATLKLVNEIGFVSSSVAKIAQEAKVSPATIYIYYKNKEDLLINTYLQIKTLMHESIFKDFEISEDVKGNLRTIWFNTTRFLNSHSDLLLFIEQFEHSPYRSLINKDLLKEHLGPIEQVFIRGIQQKLIKDLPVEMLMIFAFPPLLAIANRQIPDESEVDNWSVLAFEMAWDAIKCQEN